MACNCKKQVNALAEKYGDGSNGGEKMNPLLKVLEFLTKIIVRILTAGIIIVMAVPMLIYYIINMILGRNTRFRINNKYLKHSR